MILEGLVTIKQDDKTLQLKNHLTAYPARHLLRVLMMDVMRNIDWNTPVYFYLMKTFQIRLGSGITRVPLGSLTALETEKTILSGNLFRLEGDYNVEGPFDVINTPNAIGLLGRTLSDTQLTILINNLKAPLILYLDGDSAGLDSTIDVYKKVAGLVPDLFVCPLNEGDDPGSHSLYENSIKLSKLLKPLDFLESKGILL